MIKIGILSDTHGSVHPQIAELMNKCDFALHAGDIVDIEVLQKLNPKQSVIAVKGNNDAHLTSLEDIEVLELPGGKIVVEHGHKHGHEKPCHDSLRRAYPDAKAIINGDVTQIDLDVNKHSGLIQAAKILQNVSGIGFTYFDESDIVRHPLVKKIIGAYDTIDKKNGTK